MYRWQMNGVGFCVVAVVALLGFASCGGDAESSPEPAESSVPAAPGISSEPAEADAANSEPDSTDGDSRLASALAALEVPPTWLADVTTGYDTNLPWKDARLEIRRLLGLNDEAARKEALKLTWVYLQKNDMGDGHEYPMYTYLGGEPAWSVRAHREFLNKPHENSPIHAFITLASLYAEFGEFGEAEKTLQTALASLPKSTFRIMQEAAIMDQYGDVYVAWGKPEDAKRCYAEAIRLYPTAKPKYGRHLLPRRAAKVQTKLDVLTLQSLDMASLRSGTYRQKVLGYSGDIDLTIVLEGGRIEDIQIRHQEKIDQNACVLVPEQIIERQSLKVDAISGATITKDAIVGGVYRALKDAGLK